MDQDQKSHPEVSVIVPCYQAEECVTWCIDSILSQSDPDFELIMVDDGSADHTVEMIRGRMKEDRRIRLFAQHHQGVSAARNLGLLKAEGTYICFVDADDELELTALEKLTEAKKKNDCGLVIDIWQEDPSLRKLYAEGLTGILCKADLCDHFEELYAHSFFNSVCGKLYDASDAKQVHFPPGMPLGEDLLYNLAYIRRISRVYVMNQGLYRYTVTSSSSAVHRFNPEILTYAKRMYSDAEAFYHGNLGGEKELASSKQAYEEAVLDELVLCLSRETMRRSLHFIKKLRDDPDLMTFLEEYPVRREKRAFVSRALLKNQTFRLLLFGLLNRIRYRLKGF